jgi:hypothetical protein
MGPPAPRPAGDDPGLGSSGDANPVGDDKGRNERHPFSVKYVGGKIELAPLTIKEHERREAPFSMPQPPFMAGLFGSRGSGKTSIMISMLRLYDSVKAFDKIYIFSPTHSKDPKFEAFVKTQPHAKVEFMEVYTDVRFDEITREMDSELKAYESFLIALKAYTKFVKGKKIDEMTQDELLALYSYDFNDPGAFERFKEGRPCWAIVFDDMVGDKSVYRGDSCGLVGRFSLRHRHYNASIFFLSQAYKSGVPRQLRNNLSTAVFFANKSDKIKMEISEEMSSFIGPLDFVSMWDFACEEPHGFFMIDYDAKLPTWRFRKNFDCLLVIADKKADGETGTEGTDGKEDGTPHAPIAPGLTKPSARAGSSSNRGPKRKRTTVGVRSKRQARADRLAETAGIGDAAPERNPLIKILGKQR